MTNKQKLDNIKMLLPDIIVTPVTGGYHATNEIESNEVNFKLISQKECGIIKLQGFVNCILGELTMKEFVKKYFPIFEYYMKDTITFSAAYFAILGDYNRNKWEEFLFLLGFTCVATYPNRNDGSNYMQSMYILPMNTWEENKKKLFNE
jgi:hypothetical protein